MTDVLHPCTRDNNLTGKCLNLDCKLSACVMPGSAFVTLQGGFLLKLSNGTCIAEEEMLWLPKFVIPKLSA